MDELHADNDDENSGGDEGEERGWTPLLRAFLGCCCAKPVMDPFRGRQVPELAARLSRAQQIHRKFMGVGGIGQHASGDALEGATAGGAAPCRRSRVNGLPAR